MGDRNAIYSTWSSPRVEAVFAVVVSVDGMEGIVRRDTRYGTQTWMTDDPALAPEILKMAREASGYADAYLVRFERVEMNTTLDTIASTPESVRLLPREERLALGQRAFSVAWACLASIVDDEQLARQDDGKLLSAREAAPRFGLAIDTLYKKWRTDPQIRACSVDNGTDRPLFDPATIKEWQRTHRRKV